MTLTEKGALIDTNEQPTCADHERFANALFKKVYGDDDLVRLSAQAANPEIRKAYLRMPCEKKLREKTSFMQKLRGTEKFCDPIPFLCKFCEIVFLRSEKCSAATLVLPKNSACIR